MWPSHSTTATPTSPVAVVKQLHRGALRWERLWEASSHRAKTCYRPEGLSQLDPSVCETCCRPGGLGQLCLLVCGSPLWVGSPGSAIPSANGAPSHPPFPELLGLFPHHTTFLEGLGLLVIQLCRPLLFSGSCWQESPASEMYIYCRKLASTSPCNIMSLFFISGHIVLASFLQLAYLASAGCTCQQLHRKGRQVKTHSWAEKRFRPWGVVGQEAGWCADGPSR